MGLIKLKVTFVVVPLMHLRLGAMDMIHGISQWIVWTTESCSHMWQM